ncbi:MAG: peptidoglycan DD-metalloendopeptidase family protein [Hyphomicrobiaceae bacterium]|nr:peptidoglycan DD-metalloendopeptidase family protein [Hyphomicrobiaceae bacterium]
MLSEKVKGLRPDLARRRHLAISARTQGADRIGAAVFAAFAAVSLATAGATYAQAPGDKPDLIRQKLESQQGALDTARSRETTLSRDVAEIDAERERLNARLLETAALIQKSEAKMSSIEARLGELGAQERLVRGSLERRHGQIGHLLGALQRMGRNPPPVMITRREDALQMVRSAMLLAAAFPDLRGKALALAGQLQELVRVMTDIRNESTQLKAETQRLTDAQTKLAGLMEERKQSLSQRRAELAEVRRAAAEISRNVSDLNELIAKLDRAVTENTGLANYEREVKAAAEAAPPAQAPKPAPDPRRDVASGPIVVMPDGPAKPGDRLVDAGPGPAADQAKAAADQTAEKKVAALSVPKPSEFVELRPDNSFAANPGRIKPSIAFHEAMGRLPLPAHGRRVLNFNEKTQYGALSKGIVLETRGGAQITSPTDGWVVYAGEFRSYGQLLIINAGGGYHILLAGLSRIDVETGQFVLAAEPVGTMSGPGRDAKSETGTPVLYVEFRKNGRPIDPNPWWVRGPEKVEG